VFLGWLSVAGDLLGREGARGMSIFLIELARPHGIGKTLG
jgi:hypothetical protein